MAEGATAAGWAAATTAAACAAAAAAGSAWADRVVDLGDLEVDMHGTSAYTKGKTPHLYRCRNNDLRRPIANTAPVKEGRRRERAGCRAAATAAVATAALEAARAED